MVDAMKIKSIYSDARLRKLYTHRAMIKFIYFACGLCIFPYQIAVAEVLRDPTRPATVRSSPYNVTQEKEAEIDASGPRLQAIMISDKHRSAIISGHRVSIGEKVGSAQVINIHESEVVLQTGRSFKTLKLFTHTSKHVKINNQHVKR